jgi:RNA polymerase sigma-70 factor (ECF subfamily)
MTGRGERARTERTLVAAAVAGDSRSFERLVGRWEGEVLNLAYRLTGSAEDALDVRQAAFVRVHESLAGFDGTSRFSTWLYRIVVNLCRDHHRKQQSSRRRLRVVAERPVRDIDSPTTRAQREELSAVVAAAVATLPASQREVLVLRHFHQTPMGDVAAVLGIPVTTARSRLAQAFARLRDRLEEGQPDEL